LALFGRLPSARVDGVVMQASENLHITHRSANVSFRSRADQVADREGENVPIRDL